MLRTAPQRRFFAADLARGFLGFFRGVVMLFNRPEFAGWLKGPVIANLLVASALAVGLFFAFQGLFSSLTGRSDLLGWFSSTLSLLLTLVSLGIVLPPILELVLGPFLEPLVDITEKAMGGRGMQPVQTHLWTNIKASAHAAAELFMIAGGAWLATLVLSLLGLVPLGFLLAAAIQALTWFELPLYRRGFGLRARLHFLRHNWAVGLGFGLGAQVGMAIPLFNVLLFSPAAAVGATMLFLRMDKRTLT